MRKSMISAAGALAATAFFGVAAIGLTLPPVEANYADPQMISAEEHAATIDAMKPPKRTRPVVAVIGANDGSETTDYLVPYGVLARSEVADVVALATEPRPLKLMPALMIKPQATTETFDEVHPEGADYVIVPALHDPDDPEVVAWIKEQVQKGAIVVGICSGVRTLSAAGLLADRRATGHWYDIDDLRKANPTMRWVRDRRYVADRSVVTTTGVTASIPVSLALVEAIGGRSRASEVAEELGVDEWDSRHDSDAFALHRGHVWTALLNLARYFQRDEIGIAVHEGIDEVALALRADAYSRTYRSTALAVAESRSPLITKSNLHLIPDRSRREVTGTAIELSGQVPAQELASALGEIADRFGPRTAAFVALQMEHSATNPE